MPEQVTIFAGETALFSVSLSNPTRTPRYSVAITRDKREADVVDVPVERTVIATASVAATRRGLLRPGRFTLYTRFPVGLYYAWSYVNLDTSCVVYPQPAPAGLPLPPLRASGGDGISAD